MRHLLIGTIALVGLISACSGSDSAKTVSTTAAVATTAVSGTDAPSTGSAATEPAATDPVATEPAATEPAATEPAATEPAVTEAPAPSDPLDDLDQDGSTDKVCGTADLGGGLVVNTLCNKELIPSPETGVIPTAQSVLNLPSPGWPDLDNVDATLKVATTTDGRRVAIYILGSDALFDSGKDQLRTTSEPPIAAVVASIKQRFPGGTIVVRGAADSVGNADANQSLSERRAASVKDKLVSLGIDPATITSLGLGASVPAAEETNPDGTVSDIGRQVNRRVEIEVLK
jgi:outer membrane protein OmpA-like peptidoglycan-associated protein